jgi:hypothetical protein
LYLKRLEQDGLPYYIVNSIERKFADMEYEQRDLILYSNEKKDKV